MSRFGTSLPQIFLIVILSVIAMITFHIAPSTFGAPNPVDEIVSKLYGGNLSDARNLIERLSDINSKSSNGSPLVVAIAQIPGIQDNALYDLVFKHELNCNARDSRGMTALYFAASLGNLELVNRLLKGGADPNLESDYGSALVGASWNNKGAVARRILLVPGVSVDSADRQGRTALIFAVIHGDLDLVRELIHHGANPNVYEIVTGNSPLIWAATGTAELVGFLLDAHADSRFPNPFNCQAIIHAAVTANNIEVVRLLLQRNVVATFPDLQGRTPLGIAVSQQNDAISNMLRTILKSKGMNISETGVPPENCQNSGLTTYARPVKPSSNNGKEDQKEFTAFAVTVIGDWESNKNIFLNPDVPQFTAGQIALFKEIVCSSNNNSDIASKCKALLSDATKLRALVIRNLDEAFVERRTTTTWLAAALSDSIGIDFARAGYTVHGPNRIVCSQLGREFTRDRALFVDADHFSELRPGVTLCLREGSYEVLIPVKKIGLTLRFHTPDVKPSLEMAQFSVEADAGVTAKRIEPPLEYVSLVGEPSQSPLTLPLPLRDDVKISAPKTFSTTPSIRVSIKADSGMCASACREAVRILLIKGIAVWKMGCSRCSLADLLTIRFEDKSYFNVQTVTILTGYLSAGRQWPSAGERAPIAGPAAFSGYEQLEKLDPRISRLCSAQIPTSFIGLCQDVSDPNGMRLVLDISGKSDTCSTPNAIACASPDGVIQLRAFDHVFKTDASLGLQPVRFGSGADEFDLLAVLIHELGHFFGLPHIDDGSAKIEGKSDVMQPTYDPKGFWITQADYTLLNKAVDPAWPFRLNGCAGLRR